MKKQTLTGIALLIFTMSVGPASAGPGHGHSKGRFMAFFDTNGDGSVNMAEFNSAAMSRFNRIDADNSGLISKDEFKAYVRSRKAERKLRRFKRIDTNGNGTVERQEFLAHKQAKAERRFTRMDKNGDGSVSQKELASHQKRKHRGKRMFNRLDGNADGQISQKESMNAWSNWFKRIDANNDQVVTTGEVKAYRNNLHGKRSHK